MTQVASIAADFLTPESRQRFCALFSVAARKSITSWKEMPVTAALVLLLDHVDCGMPVGLATAPCMICIGDAGQQPLRNVPWVGQLRADYTLADLIDVLDRAAVFLLDWQARQRTLQASRAAPAVPGAGAECAYQVTSWVALGPPFQTGAGMRAMALLTREPVTLGQLCEYSGMDMPLARSLLAVLELRQVLRTTVLAEWAEWAEPPHRSQAPVPNPGLWGRLVWWSAGRS